jgi:hypothetical protein
MLRTLFQPDAVIHVGAGRGLGDVHAWRDWGVPRAWLIDADGERMDWARQMGGPDRWQVVEAVVAGVGGPVVFHQTNHPAEDGLASPEQLRAQWANLRTVSQRHAQACTLDEVLGHAVTSERAWLLIDCLPAEDILAGSSETLPSVQVVCARVVGQESEQAIDRLLTPRGFLRVARVESNHPDLGHVVFVRDLAAQVQEKLQRISDAERALEGAALLAREAEEEHAAKARQLAAQVEQLLMERQALRSEKAELGVALVNETQGTEEALMRLAAQAAAHANLQADRDAVVEKMQLLQVAHLALGTDRDALAATREAEAKAHADLKAQHAAVKQELQKTQAAHQALSQEKDALAATREAEVKAHADLKDQHDAVKHEMKSLQAAHQALKKDHDALAGARDAEIKARTELQAQRDAETKAKTEVTKERDMVRKEVTDLKARVETLSDVNDELNTRTKSMAEQLVRAEGQIELIKDLVLRDGGL